MRDVAFYEVLEQALTKELPHFTRQLHFDVKFFQPIKNETVAHSIDVDNGSPLTMIQSHFERQFATTGLKSI